MIFWFCLNIKINGFNPMELYLFFPNNFPAKGGRQRFEAAVWPELQGFGPPLEYVNALEDFYATLNDEQKAQFEAIGPRRTS